MSTRTMTSSRHSERSASRSSSNDLRRSTERSRHVSSSSFSSSSRPSLLNARREEREKNTISREIHRDRRYPESRRSSPAASSSLAKPLRDRTLDEKVHLHAAEDRIRRYSDQRSSGLASSHGSLGDVRPRSSSDVNVHRLAEHVDPKRSASMTSSSPMFLFSSDDMQAWLSSNMKNLNVKCETILIHGASFGLLSVLFADQFPQAHGLFCFECDSLAVEAASTVSHELSEKNFLCIMANSLSRSLGLLHHMFRLQQLFDFCCFRASFILNDEDEEFVCNLLQTSSCVALLTDFDRVISRDAFFKLLRKNKLSYSILADVNDSSGDNPSWASLVRFFVFQTIERDSKGSFTLPTPELFHTHDMLAHSSDMDDVLSRDFQSDQENSSLIFESTLHDSAQIFNGEDDSYSFHDEPQSHRYYPSHDFYRRSKVVSDAIALLKAKSGTVYQFEERDMMDFLGFLIYNRVSSNDAARHAFSFVWRYSYCPPELVGALRYLGSKNYLRDKEESKHLSDFLRKYDPSFHPGVFKRRIGKDELFSPDYVDRFKQPQPEGISSRKRSTRSGTRETSSHREDSSVARSKSSSSHPALSFRLNDVVVVKPDHTLSISSKPVYRRLTHTLDDQNLEPSHNEYQAPISSGRKERSSASSSSSHSTSKLMVHSEEGYGRLPPSDALQKPKDMKSKLLTVPTSDSADSADSVPGTSSPMTAACVEGVDSRTTPSHHHHHEIDCAPSDNPSTHDYSSTSFIGLRSPDTFDVSDLSHSKVDEYPSDYSSTVVDGASDANSSSVARVRDDSGPFMSTSKSQDEEYFSSGYESSISIASVESSSSSTVEQSARGDMSSSQYESISQTALKPDRWNYRSQPGVRRVGDVEPGTTNDVHIASMPLSGSSLATTRESAQGHSRDSLQVGTQGVQLYGDQASPSVFLPGRRVRNSIAQFRSDQLKQHEGHQLSSDPQPHGFRKRSNEDGSSEVHPPSKRQHF